MLKANFIPKTSVRKGHKTVLGIVKEDPEVSPTGKSPSTIHSVSGNSILARSSHRILSPGCHEGL